MDTLFVPSRRSDGDRDRRFRDAAPHSGGASPRLPPCLLLPAHATCASLRCTPLAIPCSRCRTRPPPALRPTRRCTRSTCLEALEAAVHSKDRRQDPAARRLSAVQRRWHRLLNPRLQPQPQQQPVRRRRRECNLQDPDLRQLEDRVPRAADQQQGRWRRSLRCHSLPRRLCASHLLPLGQPQPLLLLARRPVPRLTPASV